MQILDPDLTELMPTQLPDNFFIPDDATDPTVAGNTPAPASDAKNPTVTTSSPDAPTITTNSTLMDQLTSILKTNGVPSSVIDNVHDAVKKDLDKVSESVSATVRNA